MAEAILHSAQYPCISCNREVRPRQQALLCDGCNKWQHRKCSSGSSNFLINLRIKIKILKIELKLKLKVTLKLHLPSFLYIIQVSPRHNIELQFSTQVTLNGDVQIAERLAMYPLTSFQQLPVPMWSCYVAGCC